MHLKPLLLQQLPAWDDPILDRFIGEWLKICDIPEERFPDREYNNELQVQVRTAWIGEDPKDEESLREFNEFRFSVCLYLDRFLVPLSQFKNIGISPVLIIQD